MTHRHNFSPGQTTSAQGQNGFNLMSDDTATFADHRATTGAGVDS
jgi:hypothetical protein